MARIKCECGVVLSNSTHPEIQYRLISSDQWDELASRTEDGENFVNIARSVANNYIWRCTECGRLYVFEARNDIPLQIYKLDVDNGGKW